MEVQVCKNCGKTLENPVPDAKYCSIECTYGLADFKKDVATFP